MSFIKQKMTTFLNQTDQEILSEYLKTLPDGEVSNVTGLIMHLYKKAQTNGQTQSESFDIMKHPDFVELAKRHNALIETQSETSKRANALQGQVTSLNRKLADRQSDKHSDNRKPATQTKETTKPQKATQPPAPPKSDKSDNSVEMWFDSL